MVCCAGQQWAQQHQILKNSDNFSRQLFFYIDATVGEF